MFKGEKGFTLAEIVAGVIILMILATVVGLSVFGYIKDARVASLKEESIAVENDLLTNAGNYEYEGKEVSELGEEVRAVLGYHESKDTKLEGLVFEDKALRSEGEIHVGKLSMPEEELGNYDFSESGVKKMSGNGIGDEFYVYDELNQVESNVGLLGDGSLTLPTGGSDIDPADYKVNLPLERSSYTTSLITSGDHGRFISSSGVLEGWDNNRETSSGEPTDWYNDSFIPSREAIGIQGSIVDFASSGYGMAVIQENGEIAAVGDKEPVGNDFVDIVAVDADVYLGLRDNGNLALWESDYPNENALEHFKKEIPVDGKDKFMYVSQFAGVTLDGRIVEWFRGEFSAPEGNEYVRVECDSFQRCLAQKDDGTLEYFGSRSDSEVAQEVPDVVVKDYSLGGKYAVAIKEDGSLETWGEIVNFKGESRDKDIPSYAYDFIDVYSDGSCSVGIRESGSVNYWGKCDWFDLGQTSYRVVDHKNELYGY